MVRKPGFVRCPVRAHRCRSRTTLCPGACRPAWSNTMKLHLTDFWHHDPHPSPGLQTHSPLSSRASGLQPTKLQNTMYAAILVLGVPAVVG